METKNSLWKQFVKGDSSALGKLYDELFEPLVFVSFYYVRNNEVARDIVSELFVNLLSEEIAVRKLKWEDIVSIQSYLSISVRNKSIDYLRKNKLNTELINPELAVKIEENYFFDENLKLLTEDEQTFYQLHLDGYKNLEIADKYEITEKTVRNKLSLTRKKLMAYFKLLILHFLWQFH